MRIIGIVTAVVIGAAILTLSGCMGSGSITGLAAGDSSTKEDGKDMQAGMDHTAFGEGREPYEVRAILREYTVADPAKGIGAYGRYTELIVEDNAPETLKREAAECNRRAEGSVKTRADALVGTSPDEDATDDAAALGEQTDMSDIRYANIAYIVTVTRADDTAFSFLETELETGLSKKRGALNASEYTSRFSGHTFETGTGEEILLSDIIEDDNELGQMLEDALYSRYGIRELAGTDPSCYAWTADALGIRFCFNSDAVADEKRQEAGDYTYAAVTTAVPYTALETEKAAFLAQVPDEYIAQMEPETVYDLPYGDMSVMITDTGDNVVLRQIPDKGQEEDLIIEYADRNSVYFIIRSMGGFYLYRERISYQEGFFYDFSRPDGGFGRFAYNTAQYIDSYLREIGLAFAYNPRCVHMCEKKRSFGKESYDASSFIPNGYYSFPDKPDSRYKLFALKDEALSIDSYNVACRLLEDFAAIELDEEGNEAGEIIVKAGSAMILETVQGEGGFYLPPPQRSNSGREFVYECLLADGTRVRFVSAFESTILVEGAYMTRFTEPVSLWEAQFNTEPAPAEVFTVKIGGREYPVIPDYSKNTHTGEQIDFGDELWWQVEGYVGRYVMTDGDLVDMQDEYFTQDATARKEKNVTLEISEDGHAVLDYFGEVFEGDLPEKRYYRTDIGISMNSPRQHRVFTIRLREGDDHSVPEKIEVFSEGEPATNEPSHVPPLMVYLTKQ